jgi:hypothetical protein
VYYLDGIQGDGIINSTTGDLLKWDRALVNQKLIGEATLTKMMFPHSLYDTSANVHYGYGVFVGKNQFGNYVNHSGGWPGYSTNLARYSDNDKTIIVLSNNESASGAIQGTISNILFHQTITLPYKHERISLDSTSLNRFKGTYSIKGRKFNILKEKQRPLQISIFGQQMELQAESNTKVFCLDRDIQIEIEKDSTGKEKYYRILYGVKEEVEKLD